MKIFNKFRHTRKAYKLHPKKDTTLSTRTLSVFILVSFVFVLAGETGFYNHLINKINSTHKTPHVLDSSKSLPNGLAKDEAYSGSHREMMPASLQAQLAQDKKKELAGSNIDRTPEKILQKDRSEHVTNYQNIDGSRTEVVTADVSNYKDKNGLWHKVDTSLVKNSDGSYETKDNSWKVRFNNSNKGIVFVKDSSQAVFAVNSAANVEPKLVKSNGEESILYKNILPNVDIEYFVIGSTVKENIILKSNGSSTEIKFNVTGINITPSANDSGSFTLGAPFEDLKIAAPNLRLSGRSGLSDGRHVQLSLDGQQIIVSVDKDWFSKLEKSDFPVTVDPSTTPVSVGLNYTNVTPSGVPCSSGPGCGNLIGHDAINSTDLRFAYQLTVPNKPNATDYLASAKLHLEMATTPNGITGSEQLTITRANCVGGFNCIDGVFGTAYGNIGTSGEIEVGDIYRKAVVSGENNPYLLVRGEEGGTVDKFKEFDYTKTYVAFTYNTLPSQSLIKTNDTKISVPADQGKSVTTQPTLASTTSTDPDNSGAIKYKYIIGTNKTSVTNNPVNIIQSVGNVVADSGMLDSPQWVVPDGVLKDGTTYYWQAAVWDSYPTSPIPWVYSGTYSFTVDLRSGKDVTQAFDSLGSAAVDFATGNVTTSASTQTIKALGGNLGLGLDYNSPLRSKPGLVGEYYNDPAQTRVFPNSSISPTYTRIDPNVSFNWGTGSPNTGVISTDNFLARWTGWFVAPTTGSYQFGASADDGVRLYIDNMSTAYIDSWNTNVSDSYGSPVSLTAGQLVQLKYEFVEKTGIASNQLLVKTTDGTTVTPQVIPTAMLQTGPKSIATPTGLVGRYYSDPGGAHTFPTNAEDPNRLFQTRTDTTLNQNWGTNSPVPNGPTTNYLVRWKGQFKAPLTDTYSFGVGSDDGARVYFDTNTITPVTDAWSDHTATPIVYGSSVGTLNQGQTYNITVEYYQSSGSAQMGLYVRQGSLGSTDIPVDSRWLVPQAQILPDGWGLGIDGDGNALYSYASINSGGVILYESDGETHEYKYQTNGSSQFGGFVPPVNESGQMVRNADGTITLQDDTGQTYVFEQNGLVKSVTNPSDDRNPTALQYIYGSNSGSMVRIQQISDSVSDTTSGDATTATRWLKVYYGGDTINCPAAPSGFLSTSQHSYICAAKTSDGRITSFFYSSTSNGGVQLSRIVDPGNAMSDYGYTSGLLSTMRDSTTNDAIQAGVRSSTDSTLQTELVYDGLGRAISIKLPAATVGATRLEHKYNYLLGNVTQMNVTNASEPNGFTRKVTYDGTFRTISDADTANLAISTVWDPSKDLVKSTTDPAGLKSTIKYDYADRITDEYGPAPSAWYDVSDVPLTSPTNYSLQVPRKQSIYEENINGLAAAYYEVTTAANSSGPNSKLLSGAPKLHSTGIGLVSGDVVKTWGTSPPITPSTGKGWGLSLTGWVHLTVSGNYNFRIKSDDGVRLWVNDALVTNDWSDGSLRDHPVSADSPNVYTNTQGDKWVHARLDYYNKSVGNILDTDAQLETYMTAPGSTETSSIGSLLKPNYGLVTTSKVYDSNTNVSDSISSANFGSNPELGLPQSTSVDPSGLNLTTSTTYESAGSNTFFRRLTKTLPGGNQTTYSYYGATELRVNPCNSSQTFNQAGMQKIETAPDPDLAGSQVSIVYETVYDNAGRVVATRNGTDQWRCITYDDRDRTTSDLIPALSNTPNANRSARTITYNYAVGGNPLVNSISDGSGTVTTTTDLLGKTVSYVDTQIVAGSPHTYTTNSTYDSLGRPLAVTGIGSDVTYEYDTFNRLSSEKYGGITVASPQYDTYSRMSGVTYPAAGKFALTISRDSLGRRSGVSYSFGTTTINKTASDTVTLSQSNQIVSGVELGNSKTYTYDKANRLTSAIFGSNTFIYGYGAPTTCTGTYNANAGKNGNRSTFSANGSISRFCYDYADKLSSSNNSNFNSISYDSHGNMRTATTINTIEYDSSDRATYLGSNSSSNSFDPVDRQFYDTLSAMYSVYGDSSTPPVASFDNTFSLDSRFLYLPGGVLMTLGSLSSATNANNVYSVPNVHGDFVTGAKGDGSNINSTYAYEPFGAPNSPLGLLGNYPQSKEFGWHGASGQLQNQFFYSNGNFMQMGSRLYLAQIGRFAQPDPLEGGNANPYSYPGDPVNQSDVTGNGLSTFLYDLVLKVLIPTAGKQAAKQAIKQEAKQGIKQGAQQAVGKSASKAAETLKRNNSAGKAAEASVRKEITARYGNGRVVDQPYRSTPQGGRYSDFGILKKSSLDPKDPVNFLFRIEVKSGNARYGGTQLNKDIWINSTDNVPTILIKR